MEISEIKTKLTLSEVLKHYGFKADKRNRINCPFHEDKTPSMQLYWKTHTAYCFSPNCSTHGKSLDVIDFVMLKEGFDKLGAKEAKHEAIEKCKSMINGYSIQPTPAGQLTKTAILTKMFIYFKNAVHNSKPARDYIKQRGLDYEKLEIGYNSGQFHHGTRKDEALIQSCIKIGLLSEYDRLGRTGEISYRPFGKYCIIFALRNRVNQITGLYFRSTVNDHEQKHYYLKEQLGLYPHYPKADKGKLILTEAIIDAASLLQIQEITDNYELLSCYGGNGLTKEHISAIKEWATESLPDSSKRREIIFAFDNDKAGRKATEKYGKELKELLPNIILSKIELPENEDINSVFIAHQPNIFTHLLEKRLDLREAESIFLSTETALLLVNSDDGVQYSKQNKNSEPPQAHAIQLQAPAKHINELDTKNPYKLRYTTDTASYYIQGGISKILDVMKVTLVIEHLESLMKSRNKVDLYEDKQVEKLCKEVAEKLNLRKDLLESDIYKLTDLLDEYREKEMNNSKNSDNADNGTYPLTTQERQHVESFLKSPGLICKLNELLGKSGIAGEETNRIFLLVIAISYIMPEPLHALIQGSSGSGKTRLLRQISDCMPPERVIRLTRVSDKGFYNYPEKYLKNKLVSLEDVDGLGEEATFAFRELQSNGELNSATSVKLENGQIVSGQKRVKGPIASLACTTQGEMYEDNMSRVFLIAVDESQEQTKRIIKYQNNKAAGEIDTRKEQDIKRFIQNMVRNMIPYEVINPYANQIQLPEEAHKIRRLNELFQSFVKMITVINQYQRSKDKKGRLITEPEDIETGIDIMFESIVLKVDELDGSLRQFYEQLKSYVGKKGRSFEFSRFEVREATGLGKTQQHHYINKLLELEYLQQYGFANRGFKYKIVYWDNYSSIREKIKRHLSLQLEQLKARISERQISKNATDRTPANANRTPEQHLRPIELVENQ
jgi:DNA primase/energy-coupling factor transporter ATP-binding protein EcfA2